MLALAAVGLWRRRPRRARRAAAAWRLAIDAGAGRRRPATLGTGGAIAGRRRPAALRCEAHGRCVGAVATRRPVRADGDRPAECCLGPAIAVLSRGSRPCSRHALQRAAGPVPAPAGASGPDESPAVATDSCRCESSAIPCRLHAKSRCCWPPVAAPLAGLPGAADVARAQTVATAPPATQVLPDFADLVERAGPAVVNIRTTDPRLPRARGESDARPRSE